MADESKLVFVLELKGASTATEGVNQFAAAIKKTSASTSEASKSIDSYVAGWKALANNNKTALSAMQQAMAGFKRAGDMSVIMGKNTDAVNSARNAFAEYVANLRKMTAGNAAATNELNAALAKWGQMQQAINHPPPAQSWRDYFRSISTSSKEAGDETVRQTGRMAGGFRGLLPHIRTAGAALGVYFGVQSIKNVLTFADSFKEMSARLKLVSGTTGEFTHAQRALFAISQANRTSIEDTTRLYTRLSIAMRTMDTTQDAVLQTVDLLGKAMKISGASTTETAAALQQLSQALAAGILNGDEFRSTVENAPRVVKALTDYLGVNIAQLRKWSEANAITSSMVVEAMSASSEQIKKEMEAIPVTVAGAWQRVANEFKRFIGETDAAEGHTNALAKSLTGLAEDFRTIANPLAKLTSLFIDVTRATAQAGAELGKYFNTLKLGPFGETLVKGLGNLFGGPLSTDEQWTQRLTGGQASIDEIVAREKSKGFSPTPPSEAGKSYFDTGIKENTEALKQLTDIQQYIYRQAVANKIDPALALGIAQQESGFNPKAVAPDGGRGMWQFMPGTGRAYGLNSDEDRHNVEKSTAAAMKLLTDLLKDWKGNLRAAIANYNASPGRVRAAINEGRDPDTVTTKQSYVRSVLGNTAKWRTKLQTGGIGEAGLMDQAVFDKQIEIEQKASDKAFKIFQQRLENQKRLRTADQGVQVAEQERMLSEIKAQYDKFDKDSVIEIKTAIDRKPYEEQIQIINDLQSKSENYIRGMAATTDPWAAKVKEIQQDIKDLDSQISQYSPEIQGQEGLDKLQNDRLVKLKELDAAKVQSAQKDIDLQKLLADNAAKYDAVRQSAGEKEIERQNQRYELVRMTAEDEANAQKSVIDSKVEGMKTDAAVAQAEREANIQNLQGLAAIDAKRQDIAATLKENLDIIEAEKNAALDKLQVDYDLLQKDKDRLDAQLKIEKSQDNIAKIKKAILDIDNKQNDIMRQSLTVINSTAKKKADETSKAGTQTDKLNSQYVIESQLEMNDFWTQYMQRLNEYNAVWEKVVGNTKNGFSEMALSADKFRKNYEQIHQDYTKRALDFAPDSMAAEFNTLGEVAGQVANAFGTLGEQFATLASNQEKGSAAWKTYNAMAIASIVAAQTAALAQGILAIATAMASEAGKSAWGAIAAGIAVASTLAAFGVGIAGVGSAGGGSKEMSAEERQAKAGTGTVFGDSSAKSESIDKSLAIIRDNSSNDLNYSAAMLRALEGIEAAIKGTTNASLLNFMDLAKGMQDKGKSYGSLNSNTSVADWGMAFPAKKLFDIFKEGLDRGAVYLTNARNNNTETANLDYSGPSKELNRAIRSLRDALIEGGKAFGLSATDFNTRLAKFVVDLGIISLKGLNGEDMQKQLSAILSRLSDKMAEAFMPGLDKFRQVGEGYAETFWRVAEGINRATGELEQFGMKAIDYKNIADKQGDVAAEIVRQTLMEQARLSQGVTDYIAGLTGSAEDIITAYKKLVEASNLMNTAGFGDENLNRTMINAAGGLEAFTTAMQGLADNYLTGSQRLAGAAEAMSKQFVALGVAMPDSKEGFYQLLMGIDKTTESGQKLFGALLQLQDGFAKVKDEIQAIADKYTDILNPFSKISEQIKAVGDDFQTLLDDIATRARSAIEANWKPLNARKAELYKLLDPTERSAMAAQEQQLVKDLATAQEKLAHEVNKKPAKQDKALIDKLNAEIDGYTTQLRDIRAVLSRSADDILKEINSIELEGNKLEGGVWKGTVAEKAGFLKDAGKVMAQTLSDIFTQIVQAVNAAQQRLEAANTFFESLTSQIAGLEGSDASLRLLREKADAATRAVDAYWGSMSTRAERNTEEELRLLGEAQQAVTAKYNAEIALVQQLQQTIDGLASTIVGIRSQIASLQGPGAIAALAGQNYATARQNLVDYETGGGPPDYAKENTLIQAAQQAVMDKYNAEIALIQESVKVQQQAIQDNLQVQVDAINANTQAQVDAIDAASDARVEAINNELDAQQDAAQKAHEAELKGLQEQLQAAQKLTEAYKQIAEYAKAMKLGALTNLSPEAKLAEAQRQYQDTLAKARSGDADAAAKLTGASDAYLEAARAYYGSGTQYANIFDGVQAAMAQVGGLNGGNPDSIQAHIDTLNDTFKASQDAASKAAKDQIKAVQDAAKAQTEAVQKASEAQIKALQDNVAQQIADLNDPDKNVAMKALKDAAIADLQILQKLTEEAKDNAEKAAGVAAKNAEQYKTETLDVLKSLAAKAEQTRAEAAAQYANAQATARDQFAKAWKTANDQLVTLGLVGGFSQAQNEALIAIARNLVPNWTPPGVKALPTPAPYTNTADPVPTFASGGFTQGGLALVGEKGAELVNFERPAQVLTAEQTRAALNGESPKTFAALEAIKAELEAGVHIHSKAYPLLLEELRLLRERVEKMERNQKVIANTR